MSPDQHNAPPTAPDRQQAYRELFQSQMDQDALTQIRKAASREQLLRNDRFRMEIEQALGKPVEPQ